ncbi:MAG: LysR family transcriptional regulator [Gammaproteobacteria bacterium]|nr:LysR family transcriptional regulator [Gammaproteobacteria bacterium]
MNISNIDLNLFKIFDIIYREGSITKTAEIMGITQPAVSNSLSRLRAIFDDELFSRTNRGMKPTLLAQNIYPGVTSALKLLRNTVNEGDLFQPYTSNTTFNIRMNPVAQVSIMPDLVAQLQLSAPNIKLHTHTVLSYDLVKSLSNETIDIAVANTLSSPDYIKRELLFNDNYVCIARKGHPRITDTLSLKQYTSEKHLLLAEEVDKNSNLQVALAENNITQNTIFIGNEHVALPPILMSTDAIMTVTRTQANTLKNYLDILILKTPFDISCKKTFLYWHENESETGANKWLREQIINIARQNRAPAAASKEAMC